MSAGTAVAPAVTDAGQIRELNFSGPYIRALTAPRPTGLRLEERTIVVNVGTEPVEVDGDLSTPIPPMGSTILERATITGGGPVVLLTVLSERNLGSLVTDPGWPVYESLLAQDLGSAAARASAFPPSTPLFRSPQDTVGEVTFDPAPVLGQPDRSRGPQAFRVLVNLWFAPENTDCAVHDLHDFLEVHTQVTGTGRMQKFREQSLESLYQDVRMAPGYTQPPFCRVGEDGGFVYPWHQYFSDSDCVWMATEYHAIPSV